MLRRTIVWYMLAVNMWRCLVQSPLCRPLTCRTRLLIGQLALWTVCCVVCVPLCGHARSYACFVPSLSVDAKVEETEGTGRVAVMA